MANYNRLFVSINGNGYTAVRGGSRPSKYYVGVASWNGEACYRDGIWHVDCGDGREFYIESPPYLPGQWFPKGFLTTPPPQGTPPATMAEAKAKVAAKKKRLYTLAELLEMDDD